MASSSIQCRGGAGSVNRCLNSDPSPSSRLNARSPSLVQMKKKNSISGRGNKVKLSLSATKELRRREGGSGASGSTKIDHEKIDRWMPEAVVEIVKNLKQAPLLMQVYDSGLKTEKAVAEKWSAVKEAWSEEEEAPEGVILVEEIEESEDEATKAWGIVIQGRGCEYGPVCYLLKTSRVRSGVGSAACTHFCLTKVVSFRETALSQLTNCWLLN